MPSTDKRTRTRSPAVDDWEGLVTAGRRARGQKDTGKWKLGDLAIRVAQGVSDGKPNERLRQYADVIGESYESLMSNRAMASRWPPADRRDVSYHMHQILNDFSDRVQKLDTYLAAASEAGEQPTESGLRSHFSDVMPQRTPRTPVDAILDIAEESPREGADLVDELLEYPEVAAAYAAKQARREARQARREARQAEARQAQAGQEAEPGAGADDDEPEPGEPGEPGERDDEPGEPGERDEQNEVDEPQETAQWDERFRQALLDGAAWLSTVDTLAEHLDEADPDLHELLADMLEQAGERASLFRSE